MAMQKITLTMFAEGEGEFIAEWAEKQSDELAREYWQLCKSDKEKARHTFRMCGVLSLLAKKLRDGTTENIELV